MNVREQIRLVCVAKTKKAMVDGQEFVIRLLSAADVMAYHAFTKQTPEPAFLDCMTRLVAMCLCEPTHTPAASTEAELAEIQKDLALLPYASLSQLFHACTDLNRIDDRAVEKAAGNSSAAT